MDRGLLQETKCLLKSLIVSCPHGMTVDQLNKDYRKMEGQNIPFARFGFAKLEIFLKSLTDTVVVHGCGPDAKVCAVGVEKLEHIDKLVSRQKNATRDRKNLPTLRSQGPVVAPPPLSYPIQYSYYNNSAKYQQPQYHPPMRSNNSMWILPNPPNQQQQAICYNYNHFNGYNIHWNTNIARPAPAMHNIVNNSMRENVGVYNTFRARQENLLKQSQEIPPENFKQNNLVQIQAHISEKSGPQQFRENVSETHNQSYQNISVKTHQKIATDQRNSNFEKSDKQSQSYQNSSVKTHQNIVTVQSNYNFEISDKQGHTNQQQKVAEKLNENETGYQTAKNKIQFTITKTSLPKPNNESFPVEKEETNESEISKDKLQRQTNSNSGTKTTSEDESSVYNSGKFKKSFVEVKPAQTKSFLKNRGGKKKTKRTSSDSEAIPELAHNDIVFLLDYPAGSVKFGEKLLPSEIPKNIVEEAWFGIFVTEVHNPYKFWFHLYKENHELDSLMQDIESFYEKLSINELQICHSNIKPGQVCAALFLGMWHRAEILEFPVNQQVKLFFVDYGTVADVHVNNIKYLLHEYSTLRSQAMRGCLAYIKPATHRWSRDATYAFLDMVSDLLLYAKATEINNKERIIHMIITDTNDERDFQINDALIRKGHARFCQEAYSRGLQNQTSKASVC